MSEVLEKPKSERMTMDKTIASYVKLRDRKKEIEARHAEELAPYVNMLARLEAHMLDVMDQAGLNSMKSDHGTAYKSTRTSAKVTDFDAFITYVREHEVWELIEHRVAKKAAEAIIEETQLPIPGVDMTSEVVVNVRRAAPAC